MTTLLRRTLSITTYSLSSDHFPLTNTSTKGTKLHGQVEEMKEVFSYECPISFPPHPFFQIFFLPINIFSHFPCSDHQSHRVNLTKYNIECALELSTHLHEVALCMEKAHTRVFSLLKAR